MTTLAASEPNPAAQTGLALILALGVTQVAGYGALYYAFAVLAPGMTASFGWAPEWTHGGFALGPTHDGNLATAVVVENRSGAGPVRESACGRVQIFEPGTKDRMAWRLQAAELPAIFSSSALSAEV